MKEELAVKKSVTVNAPQKHVFTVFTEGHSSWWPMETHHIGAQTPQTVIIEPRVGGRWFERAADGTECDWGRVLHWEPFGRLILSWELSAQFTRDPNLKTEVEVRFIAEGSSNTTFSARSTKARLANSMICLRGAPGVKLKSY
jgi:uncharacterized protein YndB with AHSA1/START domain